MSKLSNDEQLDALAIVAFVIGFFLLSLNWEVAVILWLVAAVIISRHRNGPNRPAI